MGHPDRLKKLSFLSFGVFLAVLLVSASPLSAAEVFSPQDVFQTKTCTSAEISPSGEWIAYTVSIQRNANDKPGGAYSELYLVSPKTGEIRPFITGKVNIRSPRWSPDGSRIAFLTARGEKAKTQVWMMRVDGGEAVPVTSSGTSVSDFRWHPDGIKIAYLATSPKTKKEEHLAKKGYDFIFYEEEWKHRNIYLQDLNETGGAEQITEGITVWSFEFSPDGKAIAAAASAKNLIDHRYMFQKVYLVDLETRKMTPLTDNPGKLGNFVFSPDGTRLAYTAALERKDHAVSQVFVIPASGAEAKNLTVPDFRGHVNWVGWKDDQTLLYRADEGVRTTLSLIKADGGERKVILHGKESGFIFSTPSYTKDFKHFALVCESPEIPADIYSWEPGGELKRLTSVNSWLKERKLGEQRVIQYEARDGREVEGLLILPVGYKQTKRYPLIVFVHGGPESHYSNGWLTSYSRAGQVYAGKGYAVFYPNYRASTGYGVAFALEGFGDPAGKEFDDIADGIDFLVEEGIADRERVGLAGGSYGGYASGWFATYYTRYVKAVCMFVGISDLISKAGTTDIPYEILHVHFGQKLEDRWQMSLERSPIYWAHQSKTAVLIYGGAEDTRVDPGQSRELYRRLKMNNHPAVRLVQYPGEEHGNRKQPGRIDVLFRQMDWFDWYVRDLKPLEGPMPPLDISKKYGLDLEK